MSAQAACELCREPGGVPIASAAAWRVVRVADHHFPAFYRVIWQAHVREFSELPAADRALCMDVVAAVEQVLLRELQPVKVNLASLGNVVPHLHWHVVARFEEDSHFPQPIWGASQRVPLPDALVRLRRQLPMVDAAVRAALA